MYYIIATALGLIVGSFLNVCIFRIPKEESIVFPASHCQSCNKPIAPTDNIPVISFLLLKGQCRHCHAKIDWQYPMVEILSACFFVLFYHSFGLTVKGVLYLIFALALLVQTFIDLRHQIIPDSITLPGMLIGLVASSVWPDLHGANVWWLGVFRSSIGLLVGGGFFYVTGTIAEWVLKKEAIGGGDVKLLAMIGALLGWRGVACTIFLSSLSGAIIGLYLKFAHGEERIPFGPYIALGAVLYIFFGQKMIWWYAHAVGIYR